jgi:hypothetical protein
MQNYQAKPLKRCVFPGGKLVSFWIKNFDHTLLLFWREVISIVKPVRLHISSPIQQRRSPSVFL